MNRLFLMLAGSLATGAWSVYQFSLDNPLYGLCGAFITYALMLSYLGGCEHAERE